MSKNQDYRRILIVRLDRIGDVLLSTPVIKALRSSYPGAYIAFMVRPYSREIVEGNPYLNEMIIYDKEKQHKGFWGNLKFVMDLRRKKFDLALVLHPTVRTHVLTALAGIPERVGYDRKWGHLLTRRIPHTKQFGLRHEIDYSLDLLRYIGIEPKDKTLFMPLKKASEEKIGNTLRENGIGDEDIIFALNPSASCPSKRWPPERFAQAADALTLRYNAKIIIVSDDRYKKFADRTAAAMKQKCLNLAGRTTISDLASLLGRARLFISNDSGPIHIASAVGTPVVAIFGRGDRGLSPVRWGPAGKDDVILHKPPDCEVCLAHACKLGFKCLEAVKVDDVLKAAEGILKTSNPY